MPSSPTAPPHPRSRRRLLAAGAAALAVLTACGGGGEPAAAPPAAAPAGAGYPVTIEHQFGSTTVPAAPQRIVAVGFNEADFVLALGEVPVGVRDFIGDFDEDSRSWAAGETAGTAPEKVGGTELDMERIAALSPDLILGVYAFMEQSDYDLLSRIAPTIAQPGPEGATWQEQTLITGRALGDEAAARTVVADVERKFADAAAAHPEFAGKSVAVALTGDSPGSLYALEPSDLRSRFFTDLGFVADGAQTGSVSAENYGVFDRDVLVVLGADETTYAQDPLFQNLAAVREGRVFYGGTFDSEFSGALGFASPLSLPRALELAVPQLAAAADGDPATTG